MKLTIKMEEIDYGDAAIKAIPMLEQTVKMRSGAVEKTVAAIAMLPENMIRDIFDAIPPKQKNEILAAFAMEQKERILHALNDLLHRQKLGLTLADCSVDPDLTVMAEVSQIDYLCITERFLPLIREKLLGMGGMAAMLRPVISRASAEQVYELVERFVGSGKDAFVASLINQNQRILISAMEDAAEKQGVRMKIHAVAAEV